MSSQVGIREIKALLQDRVDQLVRELLPKGRREGNLWTAPAPQRTERTIGGFKVWLRGQARGCFKDYGAGDDAKGDIIDLIAFCRGGDRKDALSFARDYLGLARMSDADRHRVRQRVVLEHERAEQREAERLARRRRQAFEKFLSYSARLEDTPAEAYFEARGTPYAELKSLLAIGTYRFAASLEWWKGAEYRDLPDGRRTKIAPGPSFPALVSALRNASGIQTGLHATFLKPDGSGKAEVDPPKLMFGTAKGSVIRVAHGPSMKSPEDRPAAGPLVVTEGNEDGWAAVSSLPECRVWAAGSLSNISEAPVWLDCVSEIYVAAQNDTGNVQASETVLRAIELLAEFGKPVAVLSAERGKDLSDTIRGAA